MLKVEKLNVYYGESHILRDVDLEVPAGKVVCLMGRNGVGKTTLLKTVMGVLPARSGRITLGTRDVTRELPFRRSRLGMGYAPQGREIFPQLSVHENLMIGMDAIRSGERKIPEEIFELFPVLKQMIGRRGGDLSGGQQQQLAIARALAAGPKLLLLDEPTEGIQPSIIKDIGRVIRMLADRKTMAIVLVEQYYDFAAELADQYLVMERGEIVQRGRGKDMHSDGVRARMSI